MNLVCINIRKLVVYYHIMLFCSKFGYRKRFLSVITIIQLMYSCCEGISDKEIHHLKIDLKEVSSNRIMRLPSATKHGAIFRQSVRSSFMSLSQKVSCNLHCDNLYYFAFFFSGTEVLLSTYEEIDGLVTMISHFFQKVVFLTMVFKWCRLISIIADSQSFYLCLQILLLKVYVSLDHLLHSLPFM